jgi:hypothetical protein
MRHLNNSLLTLGLVFAVLLLAMPQTAHADKTSAAIGAKTKKAMDEYDMMEFESAKKLLSEAIAFGEKKGSKSGELASAYVNLGIVLFSGLDERDGAAEAFESAVRINSTVELDVAYSTPELAALLKVARDGSNAGAESCLQDGLEHDLVDEAPRASTPEILARVGTNVKADKVLVFYRGEGQLEFKKLPMKKMSDCDFVAKIPRNAMQGEFLHYYVAAVDTAGKEIERKGSSGSPNIIEVAAATGGSLSGGNDNPLTKEEGSILGPQKAKTVFLSVGIGTGSGLISGPTEKLKRDLETGGFAPALLHIMPELGYYLNSQMSVSAAFRMGFPLGANVEGHATFAPALLMRFRYALREDGEGLQFSGVLGGGVVRNTVVIDEAPEGMNTDTTAMGPLLFGGGLGYLLSLGGPMKLVAEVNALAALTAGFDELGTCPGDGCVRPTNGAQFDANIGVLVAF